ncbi:disease resistance protein L6-like [Rhodamnia argentea]|uniref:Disease resistance protein L6-like n=1 Tax=Rhodamnia argentea TaxID=178133 RepID=A0ABM3H4Q3_9MYRT|nr:disease resistance protein L6-like [Rhodamnia argentea]
MDFSDVTDRSSSMSRQPPHEVFLSFRGPEMRRGFADFLYTMLSDTGIRVFRDEEELERGKENYQQPIQVIEECKISIPIISEEYASSRNCLTELGQMVKGMDNRNRIIIPIFYYVDPSDVRDCNGPFASSFVEHKERGVSDSVIDSWKSALRRIGELEGHHLHEKSEVSPGEIAKRIVDQVQQKLKKQDLIVTKQLVRVDSHVQGIMAKLNVAVRNGLAVQIGDTREKVLGINGIPGVGKTVLAKCVYNQLYHLFDACSFLGEIQAKIKHHGIVSVQNKLISDLDEGNAKQFDSSEEALLHIRKNFCTRKVLVLLDDVYDHEQLSELVGELDWLGPGSRVILTSQTQDVLRNIDSAGSFVLEPMKQDEALKLFCRHAFGTDSPLEEFEKLSSDIVAATAGLPSALEAIGSSLFLVKSKKAWRETLTALEAAPHKRVQAASEKSHTNLDKNERQIFLDIACFFIGEDNRIPYYMWDDCNCFPSKSILALNAASLVEIGEDNELGMHEILKNFGRELFRNQNRDKPFKRGRLWDHEEAPRVLKRRKGTGEVEPFGLEFGDGSKGHTSFDCDQFDGLENLSFLNLDRIDIQGNFGDRLSSLMWLDWPGCPKNIDFQTLNLGLQNLVVLDLSWRRVNKGWSGWKLLEKARKLKVLKLTGCVQLTATPEFPASMELERLILEDCSNLSSIHPSFGNLEKLI